MVCPNKPHAYGTLYNVSESCITKASPATMDPAKVHNLQTTVTSQGQLLCNHKPRIQ